MGSSYRGMGLALCAATMAVAAAPLSSVALPKRRRGGSYVRRVDHEATRARPKSDSLKRLLKQAKR